MTATSSREQAALELILAVGDAIRDLGAVPSGHLYARVMSVMSLDTFDRVIGAMKKAGLVEEKNHVITWVGPKKISEMKGGPR